MVKVQKYRYTYNLTLFTFILPKHMWKYVSFTWKTCR